MKIELGQTLQPTKATLLSLAADAAGRYVEGERHGRASPTPEALAALDAFTPEALDRPISPTEAVDLLDRIGGPAAMRTTGGRYFGFVNGGVEPAGLAASLLSAAWDQNLALPVMSPIGARLDEIAARWVIDLLGLPTGATATFCAGATIANITAVLTARDALLRRVGCDVRRAGLTGAPPLTVITSAETHVSVLKAVVVAGLGLDNVAFVPTDECGCIRADAMPAITGPTLVILQAGNVNTGHSDPFAAVIDQLDRAGTRNQAWIHVDGAFGLWANATPHRRHLLVGVERADSWATDAHKWLNSPYDCGIVICANGAELRASMSMDASYASGDADDRPLMSLGLQMSQAARAVPVWAILATLGRAGVAEAIERCCRLADRFAQHLSEAGAELLAPVVLNQALVSFGSDVETDEVIAAVQADGTCWMGATTWQGRRAMRISVSDTSTTAADVDAAVGAITRLFVDQRRG